ncbi:MAG: hypothetical protein Aurels2KO_50840 [Aureliella sp.]
MIKLFVLALIIFPATSPQEASEIPRKLSQEERQVIAICAAAHAAVSEFHIAASKIKDPIEQSEYCEKRDPTGFHVNELVAFERKHRGSNAALMASRRLILLAAAGGEVGSPVDVGRHEAILSLPHYADNPVLPEVLRYLAAGNPDGSIEDSLREIIAETDLESNKLCSQYFLARWFLNMRDSRDYCEKRLAAIDSGEDLDYPQEREQLVKVLSEFVSERRIPTVTAEALLMLEEVSKCTAGLRQPVTVGKDDGWHVLELDLDESAQSPLLADLAEAVLFGEQHLRIGKPAPALDIALASGGRWSMSGNLGRTVVIQFSMKGCQPCVEMYPTLKKLHTKYEDKISVLSIMVDKTVDYSKSVLESGEVNWDVAWDGQREAIAQRWGVRSYPTVYVVAPDGSVAAKNARGETLVDVVSGLIR